MSAVEVKVEPQDAGAGNGQRAPEDKGAAGPARDAAEDAAGERRGRRRVVDAVEVEIEREVTKRQLIQSVSSIVVVILYMIFTLLRDRESGVVVVDPDDGGDDWDE